MGLMHAYLKDFLMCGRLKKFLTLSARCTRCNGSIEFLTTEFKIYVRVRYTFYLNVQKENPFLEGRKFFAILLKLTILKTAFAPLHRISLPSLKLGPMGF